MDVEGHKLKLMYCSGVTPEKPRKDQLKSLAYRFDIVAASGVGSVIRQPISGYQAPYLTEEGRDDGITVAFHARDMITYEYDQIFSQTVSQQCGTHIKISEIDGRSKIFHFIVIYDLQDCKNIYEVLAGISLDPVLVIFDALDRGTMNSLNTNLLAMGYRHLGENSAFFSESGKVVEYFFKEQSGWGYPSFEVIDDVSLALFFNSSLGMGISGKLKVEGASVSTKTQSKIEHVEEIVGDEFSAAVLTRPKNFKSDPVAAESHGEETSKQDKSLNLLDTTER